MLALHTAASTALQVAALPPQAPLTGLVHALRQAAAPSKDVHGGQSHAIIASKPAALVAVHTLTAPPAGRSLVLAASAGSGFTFSCLPAGATWHWHGNWKQKVTTSGAVLHCPSTHLGISAAAALPLPAPTHKRQCLSAAAQDRVAPRVPSKQAAPQTPNPQPAAQRCSAHPSLL